MNGPGLLLEEIRYVKWSMVDNILWVIKTRFSSLVWSSVDDWKLLVIKVTPDNGRREVESEFAVCILELELSEGNFNESFWWVNLIIWCDIWYYYFIIHLFANLLYILYFVQIPFILAKQNKIRNVQRKKF
jgi:hypothetical protein